MRRLLSGLVSRGTGRPWATARPYYEGLPVVLAARGTGRTGRKPRDGGPQSTGPGTEERSRGLKEERRKRSTRMGASPAACGAPKGAASSIARGRAVSLARGRGSLG